MKKSGLLMLLVVFLLFSASLTAEGVVPSEWELAIPTEGNKIVVKEEVAGWPGEIVAPPASPIIFMDQGFMLTLDAELEAELLLAGYKPLMAETIQLSRKAGGVQGFLWEP